MSLFRDFYYDVKPFLPLYLRMAVRRAIARFQLRNSRDRWPILPGAGTPPKNWKGWPNGKKFAFVLTHDVEGQRGLDHCESLLALERDLGFRSSFNFIPEGPYKVSQTLLDRIKSDGFEVGVHDLHHNGKLYRNKKSFDAAAPRINHYLHAWDAVGFRSGFMQRNLEWLHSLHIEYDMSTFDTDPFEPQPEGAHTIFPFWVPKPASTQHSAPVREAHKASNVLACTQHSHPPAIGQQGEQRNLQSSICNLQSNRSGYVELPYTLPQDSTLFLILRERDISIWKKKIDWIAERGGMALVNVHPDYLDFGQGSRHKFPAHFYKDFLNYVKQKHGGDFCHFLPREVARHLRSLGGTPHQIALRERVCST